jgi:glycine hydroxymethyltransferase
MTGREGEQLLDSVNITANRNVIPFDDAAFNATSGLRVGSPAVTTRGFEEADMRATGELVLRAIAHRHDPGALDVIRGEVVDLLDRFPLYEFL